MHVLLGQLPLSNVGCYTGNMYVGSVGYADGICLIEPSCQAVHKMLSVCEVWGQEYRVNFN